MTAQLDTLCAEIREHYRARVDFHRAEKALTLQGKAICRRLCQGDKDRANTLFALVEKFETFDTGDAGDDELVRVALGNVQPILDARRHVATERKRREKIVEKLAKQLPVWLWVEQISGFGPLGLGQIVGEAGPLHNYSNPAKLWKRMGLAVINGGRQRKVAGADALDHGYSPERRAVMFVIGDSLLRKQNDYRVLRDERKQVEREKAEAAGLTVCPAAKIPADRKAEFMSDGHVLNRANRYVQKRLLRDLWRAWRGAM